MNLKKRMVFSNTITVTLPIIITLIVSLTFIHLSSTLFGHNISYESFKELLAIKAELSSTKDSILEQSPENLEDNSYYDYILQRLSPFNGDIIVIKNNDTIFSSKNFTQIDVENCIDTENSSALTRILKLNNINYNVQLIDITFKDNTSGKIILLIPMDKDTDVIGLFLIIIFIIFVVSLITINIINSYLLSKGILKPVALLKSAASEISSGNLECEIIEDGDEEIKELCSDFEKMRIQLKNTVYEKMIYDDNRKLLVSSISHDLKTPITSIKGYVEGILDGIANTPEKVEEYLRTIYSKSEQMDGMIDDLLLYSKLDLNQLPFNFEKTDIIEYFEYCIFESTIELSKANIHISLKNELREGRYVVIDKDRMRRVITNILDNCRKYINKEKGLINIILRETNLSIIIEIRDNGSGIDEKEVNRIFDRFYRSDVARTETKGSGLGLAIAKQIVEGHKGKIWAVSHKNEGTSIMISLAKV